MPVTIVPCLSPLSLAGTSKKKTSDLSFFSIFSFARAQGTTGTLKTDQRNQDHSASAAAQVLP